MFLDNAQINIDFAYMLSKKLEPLNQLRRIHTEGRLARLVGQLGRAA